MKALSINQPWAWVILHNGKNIENRKWRTNFRGDFYIHAGKKFDKNGVIWINTFFPNIMLPDKYVMGGIIGKAKIIDCVNKSDSPWFFGPYGFVLENIEVVDFIPCLGMLNFFEPKIT